MSDLRAAIAEVEVWAADFRRFEMSTLNMSGDPQAAADWGRRAEALEYALKVLVAVSRHEDAVRRLIATRDKEVAA